MTRAALKSRWRCANRPGQSLVEFVLIAPLLLLLLFGMVEFARAWNIRHVVTDAAREGARHLVIDHDDTMATNAINNALSAAGLTPAKATIVLDNGLKIRGNPSRVSISYPYDLSITRVFLGWAIADAHIDIATQFEMRNE